MAANDIRVRDTGGLNVVPTRQYRVQAGQTILAGEPVKLAGAGSPYVIRLADGDPVIGTTQKVVGVTKNDATATASADGYVDVYVPTPTVVFEAKAKTASTFDTLTEVEALLNDRVVFDLTSSTFTVDAAAGDAAASGIEIVGGNPETQVVYFTIRASALQGLIA